MAKSIRGVMVALAVLAGVSEARAEPLVVQVPSTLQLDFESDGFGFFGNGFSVTTLPSMTGGTVLHRWQPGAPLRSMQPG